jgi:hypothetical protein
MLGLIEQTVADGIADVETQAGPGLGEDRSFVVTPAPERTKKMGRNSSGVRGEIRQGRNSSGVRGEDHQGRNSSGVRGEIHQGRKSENRQGRKSSGMGAKGDGKK